MTLHDGKSSIAQHSKSIYSHPAVNYVFRKGSYVIKRIYTLAYKLSFYFSKIEYFQVGHRPGIRGITKHWKYLGIFINLREIFRINSFTRNNCFQNSGRPYFGIYCNISGLDSNI